MKVDLDHVLFKSAYLLCLIDAMIFGYSTFSALPYAKVLSMLLRVCAAMLVLAKLMLDRHYSLQLLAGLFVVGVLLLITFIKSGYSHLFYLLIICLGIRNIDKDTIVLLDFWSRVAICLFIIACGLTGIIENYITYRTNSAVLRYSIGFNHPNTVASLALSLILQEAWIKKRRASGLYTLAIWLIAFVIYLITANRTAVLIMLVFPVAMLMTKERPEEIAEKRCTTRLLSLLIPAASVFSYCAMKLCRSSEFFRAVDVAMSNRFYNTRVIFDSYGVEFLGQQVALVSVKVARLTKSSIALLDVAYLRLLIQAGPLVLLVLAILYAKATMRAYRCGDRLLLLIICVYVLFGLCESGFNNVFMNFTLLFAAKELFAGEECMGEGALCSEM